MRVWCSCVVFDPLDGSSNIDAGVNVGTIFGVYKIVGFGYSTPQRRIIGAIHGGGSEDGGPEAQEALGLID